MKTIDVLLIYEHPERELENILLLMSELEKRHLRCELLQVPTELLLGNKYYNKVKMVLVPYMYYNEDLYNCVYKIVGKVNYIINLRWEQVLSVRDEKDVNTFMYPKQAAKGVKHICWGEIPYQRLLECDIKEANLIISGALHLDFLRDKLIKYYKNRIDIYNEFKLDNHSQTILFISSFSYVNLPEENLDYLKMAMGEKEVEEFISISCDSQKQILEWFEVLLKKGYTIIYRPHPAENISELVCTYSEKYSNFRIIPEYSVKQWILVSDFVLSWISTSYIEAYVANVPCGILRPFKLSDYFETTVLKDIKKIEDLAKLENFLMKENVTEQNDLVEQYYQIDDQYAYLKIADYIEKIINDSKQQYIWSDEILNEFNERRKEYLMDVKRLKIVKILYRIISVLYLKESNNTFIKKVIRYHKDIEADKQLQKKMADNILNRQIKNIKRKLTEILD